jgi:hypothetical protein
MGTDDSAQHGAMEGTPQVAARLTITMLASGLVHVDFPQAPVIAYGMLHEAQRIMDRHFEALAQPMIQAPNGAPRAGGPSILDGIRRKLG